MFLYVCKEHFVSLEIQHHYILKQYFFQEADYKINQMVSYFYLKIMPESHPA